MKDLRARRAGDLEVDLEGPRDWNRGDAWDSDSPLHRGAIDTNSAGSSARAR
jgi:hypothetical protein